MRGVPLHGSYSYKKKPEKATLVGIPKAAWHGGFDPVIGNPPYVRIQGFPGEQISYLIKK